MKEMQKVRQQIFIASHPDSFPSKGFELASKLAKAYEKEVCFLGFHSPKDKDITEYKKTFTQWIDNKKSELTVDLTHYILENHYEFEDLMEESEASMIIFEISDTKPFNKPLKQLQMCRQLRIPYFFVKPDQNISFDKVLVPVGFLNEEKEKGPFSSSMGRFFQSEILLMPAKDYGSRAKQNTESIQTLLDAFQLKYQYVEAKKDSFKVEMEAAQKAKDLGADMLIISASRDYGLDDIFFGPKELKIIRKSPVPVMVINPRKDLYTLCA
jgi:nucleotide-binding universal stress UspA family protein